jgi:chaperone BCS1
MSTYNIKLHSRGYLFHGPPGFGKTSLSFALTSLFGLSVYCVSLSEVGLGETHLATLFHHLSKRCIVLLEDIDSAGLRREGHNFSDTDFRPEAGAKIARGVKSTSVSQRNSLINLASLLNIIDSAASQEVSIYAYQRRSGLSRVQGRVLIMTTNHPQTLDPALIRPGRIFSRFGSRMLQPHRSATSLTVCIATIPRLSSSTHSPKHAVQLGETCSNLTFGPIYMHP